MFRTLIFSALVVVSTACGSRQLPTTAHKGQIIALTDSILDTGGTDTIRFGRLRSGEIAVLRFLITNNASRSLAVTSYDRSCGCTTLEFDAQPIKPGNSRQFPLTFDSRGEHGWQLKVIDINLAGAHRPLRIYVEAEVE